VSYVAKTLQQGEEIEFRGRVSFKPVWLGIVALGVVLGTVLYYYYSLYVLTSIISAASFIFGSLLITFPILLIYRIANEIVITSKRVIYRKGIVFRRTHEIDRGAIESIELNQSIFGRILDYGDVVAKGRGIGKVEFKMIDNPVDLRNAIRANV